MLTKTDVANAVLIHLGETQFIDDIETATFKQASVLKQTYSRALRDTLALHPWKFALRSPEILKLYDGRDGTHSTGYQYIYLKPKNCTRVVKVDRKNCFKDDNIVRYNTSQVPFKPLTIIREDSVGGLAKGDYILSDLQNAWALPLDDLSGVDTFDPSFGSALAAKWAMLAGSGVITGVSFGLLRAIDKVMKREIAEAIRQDYELDTASVNEKDPISSAIEGCSGDSYLNDGYFRP